MLLVRETVCFIGASSGVELSSRRGEFGRKVEHVVKRGPARIWGTGRA